jgi:hypothetical protein
VVEVVVAVVYISDVKGDSTVVIKVVVPRVVVVKDVVNVVVVVCASAAWVVLVLVEDFVVFVVVEVVNVDGEVLVVVTVPVMVEIGVDVVVVAYMSQRIDDSYLLCSSRGDIDSQCNLNIRFKSCEKCGNNGFRIGIYARNS